MTSKKIIASLIITILGVFVFTLPVVVFGGANKTETISNITSNKEYEALDSLYTSIKDSLNKEKLPVIYDGKEDKSNNTYTIELDMEEYNSLGKNAKKDVLEILLSEVNGSNVSRVNRVKIYNFISTCDPSMSSFVRQLDKDMNSDFASAYSYFRPVLKYISKILGIVTLIIFISLGVSLVLDLAFITIPIIQSACLEQDGKPTKIGRLVSIEARNAIKNASSDASSYREPVSYYFSKKVKQVSVLFICLLYLISGQIYDLLASIMDLFNGILK